MIKYSGEWEEEQARQTKKIDRYIQFLKWLKEKEDEQD